MSGGSGKGKRDTAANMVTLDLIPTRGNLICISMEKPVEQRHPHDAEVEPRRPVRDVVQVKLYALAQGSVAAPAVYLGPAGDACLHGMAGHVGREGSAGLLGGTGEFPAAAPQGHGGR